ncbi:MAG: hypothetical protein IJW06_02150 [Clostridia bacterium]|nr:hypothetical protein [Clostridia bacterium]
MAKRGFILFADYAEQFCSLSDAECGRLIKAIFIYETTGEVQKLPPRSSMAFSFIKNALDENRDKYAETCKKRSEAGKKGGIASAQSKSSKLSKCYQMQANQADTETDTKTETETDTVTETESKTQNEAKPLKNSPTLTKEARGEFGNVFLSDENYRLLIAEYGKQTADEAINLLSTRIARDNRYKDENHYATIKSWVITAVYEQRKKVQAVEKKPLPPGFDFDFEDIYERP